MNFTDWCATAGAAFGLMLAAALTGLPEVAVAGYSLTAMLGFAVVLWLAVRPVRRG